MSARRYGKCGACGRRRRVGADGKTWCHYDSPSTLIREARGGHLPRVGVTLSANLVWLVETYGNKIAFRAFMAAAGHWLRHAEEAIDPAWKRTEVAAWRFVARWIAQRERWTPILVVPHLRGLRAYPLLVPQGLAPDFGMHLP